MEHHELDLAAVARLDDVALMAGLHRLVQRKRALTARLLVHLGKQMKRRFAQTTKPRSDAASDAAQMKSRPAQPEKPRSAGPDALRDAASMQRRTAQTEQPTAAPHAALDAASMERRVVQTTKPRSAAADPANAAPWSRYVRRAVVREVYARDGGQCTFVSPDGRRCSARDHLELHHEDPFARGGLPTVGNVRLLCHAHNALLAERDFGRAFIEGKRRQFRPGKVTNRDPSRSRATPSGSDRHASESAANERPAMILATRTHRAATR
ncbi:MAG TPA: hypothetical protein VJV78_22290 [Polyangiales bacterium]|nr:hypothetical protein [Polyangiales bacterium]